MASVSSKLSNSIEGALAGGGDPATSPLYVFGPFLRLLVVGAVGQVTFGASIWLVVFTIAMVSAMYRLVMAWVTDGSGGSGLSEEEFGGWAVKVNASITFIEYTLTFLVSMAAMVTFIADRFPLLNSTILGMQYRTIVAIILSILTGWLVNRGPKVAARAFGPATAGVLILLWAMVITTVWRFGFQLPSIDLRAFRPEYLHFTLGGYARILAVMTGIEVFANLVAAYDGTEKQKSKKAFGSLLIIMGTTSVTMLIVGPAILQLSNPSDTHVSVFTQTMDQLLPSPLPYLGTLIGIAVLLSASAASAQGLQNLALGLTDRHYIPASIGHRNRFDVADKPVWIEVGLVSLCFLAFGTNEETYLALYAAGVFVLLSMTGWAASKRLLRLLKSKFSADGLLTLGGTVIAALLTSGATIIIFGERFSEGAWTYLLFIPVLYVVFTRSRRMLGDPSPLRERLGGLEGAMPGIGELHSRLLRSTPTALNVRQSAPELRPQSIPTTRLGETNAEFRHVLVPLDGSNLAEMALPMAATICRNYSSPLTLVSVLQVQGLLRIAPTIQEQKDLTEPERLEQEKYLSQIAGKLRTAGIKVDYRIGIGPIAQEISMLASESHVDLIVMSTRGQSGMQRWLMGNVANRIVQSVTLPVLLIHPTEERNGREQQIKRVLVALDGSEFAERVLPYARSLAASLGSEIVLLSVPEIPEAQMYGPLAGMVDELRTKAEAETRQYLESVIDSLRAEGLHARMLVSGSRPASTIVAVGESVETDLIMLATHGRGGLDRLFMGSVAERVVQRTQRPVFLVPVRERRQLDKSDIISS